VLTASVLASALASISSLTVYEGDVRLYIAEKARELCSTRYSTKKKREPGLVIRRASLLETVLLLGSSVQSNSINGMW